MPEIRLAKLLVLVRRRLFDPENSGNSGQLHYQRVRKVHFCRDLQSCG